jgi:D-alanyl-D-alanine carboxypeptidase/D-alanyl-D-alanine-endopeptidase (penicillin-binding protein 4)
LLKNELKEFPQQPRWVDGSGLSRYNLFTPDDFVWLLEKMKDEFGMQRISSIFPTGGSGTLSAYSSGIGPGIIAKSGSMGGVLALSGYLKTKTGKQLTFSILVNNFRGSAGLIRKKIEQFLSEISENN